MKKFFILYIAVSSIFLNNNIFGQNVFEKATYQIKFIRNQSSQQKESTQLAKQITEMLSLQIEKSFDLYFNESKSVYKEKINLDKPDNSISFLNRSYNTSKDIYFKNTKNGTFIFQNEFFGKVFLIKDTLPKFNWVLKKESKMIGNYLCFRATSKMLKTVLNFEQINKVRKYNFSTNDKESILQLSEINAWYTTQIPISQGPKEFWGLPGLIMEVNYANTQLLCTKLTFNKEDSKIIKIPKRGEIISQLKYDKIKESKLIEFQNMFNNKSNGN